MEEKLVRIPFDVELAKKIQAGDVEGKIVTRDGRNVRVVCWDRKDVDYPIIALIDNAEKGEGFGFFTTDGVTTYYDNTLDIMLEIPEYMTYRHGDVLLDRAGEPFIYNGVKYKGYGHICGINYDGTLCINSNSNSNSLWSVTVKGKATESETQKLIDALKASKDSRAKEYLKRFFNIDTEEPQEAEQKQKEDKSQHEFKPFDKVLVRFGLDSEWCTSLFSHKNEYGQYICCGSAYNQCIPYNEGTAHLLGTTEKYE